MPGIFIQVISALNQEQEFLPRAMPTLRLQRLPPGSECVIERPSGDKEHIPQKGMILPFHPYWSRLRTDALGIQALSEAMRRSFHVPPESEYRKAQDVFIRTLRSLMEPWLEADRNLLECFKKSPGIRRGIQNFLRRHPLALLPSVRGASLLGIPKRFPRGQDRPIARAHSEAIRLFIEIEQHQDRERLGKCLRCGRYFYGRPRQKSCPRPRRCGAFLAATRATKRRLEKERNEKLDVAKRAIADWQIKRSRIDWKIYVADRVGVTRKWITHAVNRGDLQPPAKSLKRRCHETKEKTPAWNIRRQR